jgi:large subunit ribosomal protein L4
MTTTKTTTKKATATKEVKELVAQVYSQTGASVEKLSLPVNIFGLKWNANLVHDAVVALMSNKRAGTAHTKDRGEVSGGGKKPWKQKGTGRARHGSSRSPIWVGGGITFGPRKEKDYSKKINKKAKVKALFTMLSNKFASDTLIFVDSIGFKAIKTKDAVTVVSKLTGKFEKAPKGFILALPEKDVTVEKSFANIPNVETVYVSDLNPMTLSNNKALIFVNPKATLAVLEAKMK